MSADRAALEKPGPDRGGPLFAILLISAAAIAYEILLIRVLSIVHWHHFAWMIISLALLGYGASGSAIALARAWLQPRFERCFAASALLFSVSMVGCLVLGQRLPFNALEVIWNPHQFLYLAELYLLFILPFFFAAACIGMAFTFGGKRAHRIYFFDLLGAGLGGGLVIALLFLLPPQRAVLGLAALALVASLHAGRAGRSPRTLRALQIGWLLVLVWLVPADRIGLRISEFKGLSQTLSVTGTQVLAERSGPLGLLTAVESPQVPFRYAPGLSFNARALPPEQTAVFTDGDGMSVVTTFDGDLERPSFMRDVTAALPYPLLDAPRVAVLGAGGGYDVLMALYNGASRVDAVELNPQMAALMRGELAARSGQLYANEQVALHLGEARGFVTRSRQRFDLIQLSMLDSMAVSGSGVQALSESYVYTVEAIQQYLDRLEPGGLLSITRWLQVPPRDGLKLAATTIEALRRRDAADPALALAAVRSWNTFTLVAKAGEFTELETARIREFARQRSFDLAWYPGMDGNQANRFNRLDRPWFYEGIRALLSESPAAFIEDYKYDIAPATDQRPYFFNFFKWRALPELYALRERGGAGLMEWGYLVLVATLLQALFAGSVLILLPLALSRSAPAGARAESGRAPVRPRLGGYFFLLGLAFLFIEIAFMQKFILYLAHPLYSVTVVLTGFLISAGTGSLCSHWLTLRTGRGGRGLVVLAVAGIAVIVLLYLMLLPVLFERTIGLADPSRVLITLLLIAPLAFCMGLPFPLGLRRLAEEDPEFIPWAWGINGFASVISAALAALLAIQFGFTAVLLASLVLYLIATALFRAKAQPRAAPAT